MKIAASCINGITARSGLLCWPEESARDIALPAELKAPQERFPEEAIKEAGYSATWHGWKSRNGVAILSMGEMPEEIGHGLAGDLRRLSWGPGRQSDHYRPALRNWR